jgi:hypothetical protein
VTADQEVDWFYLKYDPEQPSRFYRAIELPWSHSRQIGSRFKNRPSRKAVQRTALQNAAINESNGAPQYRRPAQPATGEELKAEGKWNTSYSQ